MQIADYNKGNNKITELRTILQRESQNFDLYVTEYGTALTTILPILFLYLNTVIVTAGTFERNESGQCTYIDIHVYWNKLHLKL
jgi:hypothetical protein